MTFIDEFNLPENAIPNGAIAICQYIGDDGEMKFAVVNDALEMPLSTTLGLLELVKLHLYLKSLENE